MAVALNNSFTFGGVNSANYGIFIDGGGVFNAPERDVTLVSIPGRSGQLVMDNGRFENIEVTYSAFIDGRDDGTIRDRIQSFRNAIGALRGYQRLEDTYNPDEYRQALFIGGLEVDPVVYQTGGEFEITFNCKPQRWLKSGEHLTTIPDGATLTNPTLFDAKPLIRIIGRTGTLEIGGATIEVDSDIQVTETLYFDCETLEAYGYVPGTETIINMNGVVTISGGAPVLEPGDNEVSFTDLSVAIATRWWRV